MTSGPSHSRLSIQDASCALGGRLILDRLSLPVLAGGQMVALLGPNGSGKSTLLKTIAGLVRVSSGAFELDGKDLTPMSAKRRAQYLRYLPQSLPEPLRLSVTEAVLVALKARQDVPTVQALDQVQAVLTELGIGELANRYLDELSGGQRQLAGLAQALVHKPRVLLLDEPLSSLDLNYQHHVMRLLQSLCRLHDMLTIVVLHDLNIALRYADAALLLKSGSLVAAGAPLEVISPAHLAQAFHVRARVEAVESGHPCVFVDELMQL